MHAHDVRWDVMPKCRAGIGHAAVYKDIVIDDQNYMKTVWQPQVHQCLYVSLPQCLVYDLFFKINISYGVTL